MTVKKVAELAGVSIGTVSRVLNGKADVSEEYVQKVEEAIKKLGYRPNLLAAGLRKRQKIEDEAPSELRRTGNIGFLVDYPTIQAFTEDEFQAAFLQGISERLSDNEQQLMFQTFREDIEANRMPLMVRKSSVDGVIIKGFLNRAQMEWVKTLSAVVPVVMLMNTFPFAGANVSSVMCDNKRGTFQAIQYLQSLGHRRIGFLNIRDVGHPRIVHHEQRMQAYQEAVHEFQFESAPGYLQLLNRDNKTQPFEEVVGAALNNWLAMGANRPTAILCVADDHALCLMKLAQEQGLQVPQDLSVIGYMNTVRAQISNPPLTSVAISGREMGHEAVDLLLRMIENPGQPACHIQVDGRLIERLSCSQPQQL